MTYHPSAKDLTEWLKQGAPAAVDVAVFLSSTLLVGTRGKIAELQQERAMFAKIADEIGRVYKGISGVNALSHGAHFLFGHIKQVASPEFFAKEGYYDDQKSLRFPGAIHRRDVKYGDINY